MYQGTFGTVEGGASSNEDAPAVLMAALYGCTGFLLKG